MLTAWRGFAVVLTIVAAGGYAALRTVQAPQRPPRPAGLDRNLMALRNRPVGTRPRVPMLRRRLR